MTEETLVDEKGAVFKFPGIGNHFFEHLKSEAIDALCDLFPSEQYIECHEKTLRQYLAEYLLDAYQLGWRVGYSFHKEQEEGK